MHNAKKDSVIVFGPGKASICKNCCENEPDNPMVELSTEYNPMVEGPGFSPAQTKWQAPWGLSTKTHIACDYNNFGHCARI